MRNLRPSCIWSWTKSMLQCWSGPVGAGTFPRSRAMRLRRLTFMRSCRPSRRYSRYTRFLFTCPAFAPEASPARADSRIVAGSWRCRESAGAGRFGRAPGCSAYHTDRCSIASRHDRRTLILKRSCIQAASSRRLAAFRAFFAPPPAGSACPASGPPRCACSRAFSSSSCLSLRSSVTPEIGVLLLPRVEGRLRDADLPAHVDHRRSAIPPAAARRRSALP